MKMFSYIHMDRLIRLYLKKYLICSKTKNKYLKKIRKISLNKIGYSLGFEIPVGILNETTIIFHQNVVVNSNAIIGNNVKFHGNNCIGNNGINCKAPKIGNNVDIGFGSVIIGDVTIADGCKIGANTIVVSSCLIEGATIVGNPGRVVLKNSKYKNSK